MQHLPIKALYFAQSLLFLITAALSAVLLLQPYRALCGILPFLWCGCLFAASCYLPLYRRKFHIAVQNGYLKLSRGVWFVRMESIDLKQVSKIDMLQGPIFALLDLAVLVIRMPGYRGVLLGLQIKTADEICCTFQNQRK